MNFAVKLSKDKVTAMGAIYDPSAVEKDQAAGGNDLVAVLLHPVVLPRGFPLNLHVTQCRSLGQSLHCRVTVAGQQVPKWGGLWHRRWKGCYECLIRVRNRQR